MNRILVTGANGQLGNEIRVLAREYPEVSFCFTDYDTLDVTDSSAVELFLTDYRPETVINCAAYTAVEKAETEKEKAFLLNALAPGILARVCGQIAARFIHISTDYVFDGTQSIPYKENDPVHPLGVYGTTKAEGEINCLRYPGTIVIRTSWLYSSFGANFVKTMLRLGRENKKISVVYDQTGTPTYAGDLAQVVLKIVAKPLEKSQIQGIYHYSNEGVCSWYDFALAIHRLAGISCEVEPVRSDKFSGKVTRPSYTVLDKSKIKSIFGISIPYWMESLAECLRLI